MYSGRAFLASALIHLSVGAAALVLWQYYPKIPKKYNRIAFKLENISFPVSSPRHDVPAPKPENLKPQPETPKPLSTKPVQEPIKTVQTPVSVSVPVPLSEPLSVPVVSKTPAVAALPKPAPVVARPEPKPEPKKEYSYPYQEKVQSILEGRKNYPKNAKKLKQQGEVKLSFDLTPSGEAKSIMITKSSGFNSLDEAAIELVRSSASLFPKPEESVKINLPIEYVLY